MRRDVFQAIADPTRREILDRLSQSPLTMNKLASTFSVSRPAISKHVRILQECGLLLVVADGRERVCHVQPQQLRQVADWVSGYREFWSGKLQALENYLAMENKSKSIKHSKKTES